MSPAPRERPHGLSRREFLRRSLGTAVVLPSAAAILAACSKPGTTSSGGTATGGGARVLARPDNPVTLPMHGEPIPTSTPIETGTLRVYNWDAYMYKPVLKAFEDEYNVTVEWTTFQNMEEGIQKLVAGQVQADVFFPTTDYVSRLVEGDLLQPLNHELIPNLEANILEGLLGTRAVLRPRVAVHRAVHDLHDRGRRTGGTGSTTTAAAAAGYDLFFDPAFKDSVSYYDSYRDALGMMLLRERRHRRELRAIRPRSAPRKDAILQMVNDNGARLTINGVYAKLPEGEFSVAEAWSGDIVGGGSTTCPRAPPRTSSATGTRDDQKGLVGNDTIAIPADAPSPATGPRVPELLPGRALGLRQLRRLERLPAADELQRAGPARPGGRSDPTGRRRHVRVRWILTRYPGELHARLHPGRALGRGRRALARRLERDPGRWLATPRPPGGRRPRDDAGRRRRGVRYPRWYWPSFTLPGLLWLLLFFVLPFYVVALGGVRHRRPALPEPAARLPAVVVELRHLRHDRGEVLRRGPYLLRSAASERFSTSWPRA